MFINTLPLEVNQLTESTSINLAKSIQFQIIQTPLKEEPISTSYVRQGTAGNPILLLHGFDSSVFEFRRLLPLLAQNNETLAVDLLGFGFTERIPNINPETIKTHLYYFCKILNQPIILVGASMGGAAAIDFTLTYPEVVDKLILIDSAGFAIGSAISRFMFPPIGNLATAFLRSPKVREKISNLAYKDERFVTPDAQLCAALHLKMPGWSQAMIDFTRSGGYNFLANRINQIKQETLILWGNSDKILGLGDAEKFKQAIAHSQLTWIENCGHVPHLEKPEETAKEIIQFITAN